ncbi:MAG: mucoidy inhibitor MuiA family protein, partial [Deltaproteobacteria bacterium]|nr:mucoidy inhibitor MuiA family protein [Deltaproteobacteria bacterium]
MRKALLVPSTALVLCTVLLMPGAARAAPPGGTAQAPALVAQEAPIERVVVYSDQARVHRPTRVTLGAGSTRVILASLPAAVLPDTVRVECESAAIANVEVARTWERLPRQAEGKALLARIEHVLDDVRALDDEQRTLRTELQFVESLQPVAERKRPDKEPPLMFVDAWRRVLQWSEARAARVRARLAALPALRLKLARQLQALRVEGRKLLPDAVTGPALRVAVTLRGNPGAHRVALSYVVSGVRWVPSYDLRYDPLNPAVEASYYALVTQSTGEDWRQARLAFSTILPSHLLAVPELPTLTLGRTTGFTPTPRERWEPRPNPWVAPAAPVRPDTVMAELEGVLRHAHDVPAAGEVTRNLRGEAGRDRDDDGVADAESRLKQEPKPAEAPRPLPAQPARPSYDFEDAKVTGGLRRPPAPPAGSVAVLSETVAVSRGRHRVSVASTPRETIPWTDTGYQPPYLDPDLPAASAKGHRFTMDAPGRHSVVANGSPVRVPLLRERFGVSPV